MRARDKWFQESPTIGEGPMSVVKVSYFSDALCIWAYIAQARIDAVKEKFGDTVRVGPSVLFCLRQYGPQSHFNVA